MGLKKDYFEKFYFGFSNEVFIQSEFLLQLYEAEKPMIDIGYDLSVSNIGRIKFSKEKSKKKLDIQVKSTVVRKECVCQIFISEEDDKLIAETGGYLICVFCEPKFIKAGGNIEVHRTDADASDAVSEMLASVLESEFESGSIKNVGELYKLAEGNDVEIEDFSRNYLWFSSKHLEIMKKKGAMLLEEIEVDGKKNKKWVIRFKKEDKNFYFCDKKEEILNWNGGTNDPQIAYELSKIRYLVNGKCDEMFFCGEVYI